MILLCGIALHWNTSNLMIRVRPVNEFEALINSHPDYVATYYHYGKLMESLQDKDAAVSCTRRA